MDNAAIACTKCNRPLTAAYGFGAVEGVKPETSAETIGFYVRGSIVCSACIMAAKTDPAALAAKAAHEAAQEAHRAHQAASRATANAKVAAIAAARKPAPKRARRPRLSAAARAERERAIEADRIAAGGHPWAEDEM